MVGNRKEMAVAPVLSSSSMTAPALLRPFISSFGGELTNITSKAWSIGFQSFNSLVLYSGAVDIKLYSGQPKTPSGGFSGIIRAV